MTKRAAKKITMTYEQLLAERDAAREVGEHNGRLRALRLIEVAVTGTIKAEVAHG